MQLAEVRCVLTSRDYPSSFVNEAHCVTTSLFRFALKGGLAKSITRMAWDDDVPPPVTRPGPHPFFLCLMYLIGVCQSWTMLCQCAVSATFFRQVSHPAVFYSYVAARSRIPFAPHDAASLPPVINPGFSTSTLTTLRLPP